MAGYAFAAGLDLSSAPQVTAPPAAKARPKAPKLEIELEDLQDTNQKPPPKQSWSGAITPADAQTPYEARTAPTTGVQTPHISNDLESSTPVDGNVAGIVPTLWYPAMNKWRVLSACITYFGNGLNDSAPGALIPYIEADYNIGYAIVSLIFITNAVGFIITAFGVDVVLSKLGRSRTLMTGEVIMLIGYVMLATTPPFPVVVAAYLFLGLGYALNLSLNNVFSANLANPTVLLGVLHGSYGIGGIVAPIIATAMVSRGILWSRFFLITICVRVFCFFFAGWTFRGYEDEPTSQFSNSLELIASRQRTDLGEPSKWKLLQRALKNKSTLIGALFIFAYQGAEVSISGWVISYLISYRGGVPAQVGYVTSGFWAGITLGRFVLVHFAPRVGEKRFVYLMIAGAIAFQLLAWLIPNVIGDAVAVAVLGLLLGPVYPCSQNIFSQLLPSQIQMTAISFISSAGSSGGAIAPFTTGLLAQAVGTFVLHPICIALFVVMAGCWFALPKVVKRRE